jgi:arabinoxylan arabinofuranohydrolase
VTNDEAFHVKASAESAYGTKPFGSVPPGKTKSRSFPTKAASVPAGKVTVPVSATLDGKPVSASLDADYAARSCG